MAQRRHHYEQAFEAHLRTVLDAFRDLHGLEAIKGEEIDFGAEGTKRLLLRYAPVEKL